jgi:hypothetical protein
MMDMVAELIRELNESGLPVMQAAAEVLRTAGPWVDERRSLYGQPRSPMLTENEAAHIVAVQELRRHTS